MRFLRLGVLFLIFASSSVSPGRQSDVPGSNGTAAIPHISPNSRPGILSNPVARLVRGDSVIRTISFNPQGEVRAIIQFREPPLSRLGSMRTGLPFTVLSAAANRLEQEHIRFANDLASIDATIRTNQQPGIQSRPSSIGHEYRVALNGVAISTSLSAIDAIRNLEYVRSVETDAEVHVTDDASNAFIGAPSFWDAYSAHGEDIDLAIIDTGIDYLHEALGHAPFPNARVVGGYNVVASSDDPRDDHGHGTHVAGIAAGEGPLPTKLRGVAYRARLWAYKVLDANGSGFMSQVIQGVELALDPDHDPATPTPIEVISMSLGGPGSPDDAASQAIDNAVAAGVVCVVAAGNSGPEYQTTLSPGCARQALTVGASYNTDFITSFSSRGPAEATFAIKPDVVAPGSQVNSAKIGGGYIKHSGTSMAAPHVAGAAALLIQLHPGWSPGEIKAVLMESAQQITADVWTAGSGRINLEKAGRTSVTITPPSLNPGLDDVTMSIWEHSDTLTIRNHDSIPREFTFSLANPLPSGVTISIVPEMLSLPPSDSATFEVTLIVDNALFDYPATTPSGYANRIVVSSILPPDTITIPVAFIKSPLMKLRFTDQPLLSLVTNSNGSYHLELENLSDSLLLLMPRGTYDITVEYPDLLHTVLREGVAHSGLTSLTIGKVDAQNSIQLHTIGTSGSEVFYPNYRFERTFAKRNAPLNAFALTIEGMPYTSAHRVSNVSDSIVYFSKITTLSSDGYTSIPFVIGDGISTDRSLQNDPARWKTIHNHYYAPPGTHNIYVFHDLAHSSMLSAPFDETSTFAPLETPGLLPPQIASLTYERTTVSSGPDPFFAGDPILYQTGPARLVAPDTLIFFLNEASMVLATRDNPVEVEILGGTPQWVGRMWNLGSLIQLQHNGPSSRGMFASPYGDILFTLFPYSIRSSGSLIDSGLINNGYCPSNVPCAAFDRVIVNTNADLCELVTSYDRYMISGVRGKETVRLQFHMLPVHGTIDRNPPFLRSFQILSDGKVSNVISRNAHTEIQCTASDANSEDAYFLRDVRFRYRALHGSTWLDLPLERSDSTFVADIPPNLPGGFYSLNLLATDSVGNVLDYLIEPAFDVTGAMLSATFIPFDQVSMACQATRLLTIANRDSAAPMSITSISSDHPDFIVTPSEGTIGAGESMEIRVTFHPLGPGERTGNIILVHSAQALPDTVVVSGVGLATDSGFVEMDVAQEGDWQLVSLPLKGCPPQLTGAFAFSNGYTHAEDLLVGQGYWVKLPAGGMTFRGYPVSGETVAVRGRWNIVGSMTSATAVGQVVPDAGNDILSLFFGYDGGYTVAESLYAGRGYWVKMKQDGSITFDNRPVADRKTGSYRDVLKNAGMLRFTDARGRRQELFFTGRLPDGIEKEFFSLPPDPPAGAFSARFASGQILDVPGRSSTTPIVVASAAYPVTIEWRVPETGFTATLTAGDSLVALRGNGLVTITNPEAPLFLTGSGDPRSGGVFKLLQNYPNPFNSSTRIEYTLPARSQVKVRIFDLLGRVISEPVDGVEDGGLRFVEWEAPPVASGIYIVRLDATALSERSRAYSETRKILLLR